MKLFIRLISIQPYYRGVYTLTLFLSLVVSFFLLFPYKALPINKINTQITQEISSFLIKSPGGTINVLSDRDENIEQFFQRSFIMVGHLIEPSLSLKTVNPLDVIEQTEFYVSYPCNNYEGNLQPAYGRITKVAPTTNTVRKLFARHSLSLNTPVFRADEKHLDVYYLVGFMQHDSAGFFNSSVPLDGENFSPKILLHINTAR